MRCDLAADSLSVLALGPHELEIQLETQPEARRGSEVAAQAQIVFRRAAAAAFFHVRQVGFLSLCHVLGPENVGMITGDATVNHDAPVICCTAEILANIALRDGAHAPVDDVIMDEFHYYSDHSCGAAW